MSAEATLGRVMLIEDDPLDQMIHERILKRSGMVTDVIGFQYAKHALEYLCDPASPSVRLILLDINLPAMNGFEFLEATRDMSDLKPSIPFVMMLTTSINPLDQERARQFPEVKAFFHKPLSQEHLQAAMKITQNPAHRASFNAYPGTSVTSFPSTRT